MGEVIGIDRRASREPETVLKVCPRCGAQLFADMDMCFACLYDFSSRPGDVPDTSIPKSSGDVPWGEYNAWIPELVRDSPAPYCYLPAEASVAPRRTPPRPSPEFEWGYEPPHAPVDISAWEEVPADATAVMRRRPLPPAIEPRMPVADMTRAVAEQGEQPTVKLPSPQHLKTSWALTVESGAVRMVRPVPQQGLSIGRSQDNDIVLCDPQVSRKHVRIMPSVQGVYVIDQGSTNPATIGGEEVVPSAILEEGQTLMVGRTIFFLIKLDEF